MKNIFVIFLLIFLGINCSVTGQDFDKYFINKTLRLDYEFAGNVKHQEVYVSSLAQLPGWSGRRNNLNKLPLDGEGQITVCDAASGDTIYRTSFSTLFEEWLNTNEAKTISCSFENTFLIPYPKSPVLITVAFRQRNGQFIDKLTHQVNSSDILIKKKGLSHITPHKYLLKSGDPDRCIDVAILAEGYTKSQMGLFLRDANVALESFKNQEPFKKYINRFNFVAVESCSEDSGVSLPCKNIWKNTVFKSHFDTFYSDRYLTTNSVFAIHDVLAGIPYEYIIVLANTDTYGGGGIYNSFTLVTAHNAKFRPVVVHEFGHSFGGLADEYNYGNDDDTTYSLNVEPWEKNITTKVNFINKWENLINNHKAGFYEGAGYRKSGIWRGSEDCRMKTNEYKAFCPVCQQALTNMINFYTK